jgi:CheY-like chemotaxis protein
MKQILVVDDDPTIRQLLLELISSLGHKVITAHDGEEGLYLVANRSVDLVVTDFDMPRMNGWNLADSIKSMSPGIPVVLATGSEDYKSGGQAKEIIFDAILLKPFSLQEIEKTVCQLLPD